MSTLRRRYEKWCKGDDIKDCTHKQRYEVSYQSKRKGLLTKQITKKNVWEYRILVKVLQQDTCFYDRKFLKSCVRAMAEQGNINHPAYGTWTADFMLRQNESKAF